MDRKRIPAPELSLLPLTDHEPQPLFNRANLRTDGRSAEQLRPLAMMLGTIPKADGSAFIEMGNCKVMAAVYGPRADRKMTDPNKGRLSVEFRLCPSAQKKRRMYTKSVEEMKYTTYVQSALTPSVRLETFVKAVVDVHITVLEEDGMLACVAGGITAASLALADAGIELYDLVAGTSAATRGSTIVMDLAADEHAPGSLLVAYMASMNHVTQVLQDGVVDEAVSDDVMDFCIDAAATTHELMGRSLTLAVDCLDNQ